MDEGLWAWLNGSPWERVRRAYLKGDVDEAEAERRLKILRWLTAILFPAGLFVAICALRRLFYGAMYRLDDMAVLAVLLIPIGPIFAWAVDRFIEQPALRRVSGR